MPCTMISVRFHLINIRGTTAVCYPGCRPSLLLLNTPVRPGPILQAYYGRSSPERTSPNRTSMLYSLRTTAQIRV